MWSEEVHALAGERSTMPESGDAALNRSSLQADEGDYAVRLQGISKSYLIFERPEDRLKQFAASALRRLIGKPPRPYYREFWALRNISFELRRGETIGIIGRNGAGKSTLLEIISGILQPNSGSIIVNGRVAALLELGCGFNPEFTGRENVYIYAGVLGLSKKEVDARFDDIAAFADIGDFINQPVKTYSTGMVVRLAFAVMTHVDADILIIDEALAVGDVFFVQKCMRFLRDFQRRGTLIFVSHDMGAVVNLCERAVWIHEGELRQIGSAKSVIHAYLHLTHQTLYGDSVTLQAIGDDRTKNDSAHSAAVPKGHDYFTRATVVERIHEANGWRTGGAELLAVSVGSLEHTGGDNIVFCGGERICLTLRARAIEPLDRPILGFLVRDRLGQDLFGENSLPFTCMNPVSVAAGQEFVAEFVFRLPMLPNGDYPVFASVADGDLLNNIQHNFLHDAAIIHVSSSQVRFGLVGVRFENVCLRTIG